MTRSLLKFGKVLLQGVAIDDLQAFSDFGFDFFHNGNAAFVHFNHDQFVRFGAENFTGQAARAGADFVHGGAAVIGEVLCIQRKPDYFAGNVAVEKKILSESLLASKPCASTVVRSEGSMSIFSPRFRFIYILTSITAA